MAYELNELKPHLAAAPVTDPVAFWKEISADGRGLEVLAALGQILDAGYVVLPTGRDLENNRIYVWPYFAELPLGTSRHLRRSSCCGSWARPRLAKPRPKAAIPPGASPSAPMVCGTLFTKCHKGLSLGTNMLAPR